MGRPVAALFGSLAAALIMAGCGSEGDEEIRSEALRVRGFVTEVRARSLLELELLQVTDERNRVWNFRPGPGTVSGSGHDYTPSHLRQHMVQGEPIIVTYMEQDGVFMIIGLSE